MSNLENIRAAMRDSYMESESVALDRLVSRHGLNDAARETISSDAISLVQRIRTVGKPYLMEAFLAEYGLSTSEGVALMCLAEALLRVPDAKTIDELIEDKIAPSTWSEHLGSSSSPLVNASTWALMLTGKVLRGSSSEGVAETLHAAVRRLGEPVIRAAVKRAMKEMGHQFVLGRDIKEAIKSGHTQEKNGYTFSYDMLGEAALTANDADVFYNEYKDAIESLARRTKQDNVRKNPGISIKLSALHPRYELSQKGRVMRELVPRVKELAMLAKNAHMGFNIDAEEADRLDLSLDVIEAVFRSSKLSGWDGFGVVVQSYGKRASFVIDWLYELANELDRSVMVRLVKGAYWDSEIKQAQVDGVKDFPVFTAKAATDISYICCAHKLFSYSDRIYPQFATHNAHTVSAILHMADNSYPFEFQRLHGMGEALYDLVLTDQKSQCRIYAPVGAHRDLLAYLVRRLLENGANSSFVNQIVDVEVDPVEIAADPFEKLESMWSKNRQLLVKPGDIYQPERPNSNGWNLRDTKQLDELYKLRKPYKNKGWVTKPIISGSSFSNKPQPVYSPNKSEECIGYVSKATTQQVDLALKAARPWTTSTPEERCRILNKAADLYEAHSGELFAVLTREAGKTINDAIDEVREAVDFLRFYGAESVRFGDQTARGIITCISPWNFPLAIFTGQIAASLAAGNGVLAKPADPTPIVASIGVRLLLEAGVPDSVLQLLPGKGSIVGAKLTSDNRINGICFTGSTAVAQTIYQTSVRFLEPDSTFIAETGGLNSMLVDSTALPEQAVQDIVDSAFRSCGQRCSALRMLYLQKDIADEFLKMLYGTMDELEIADPWNVSADVGPIINQSARQEIANYIEKAELSGKVLKKLNAPKEGFFVSPCVIQVDGVLALEREIFGPVLHVTTFDASEIDQIVNDINSSGYGLTFGLHTRIDDRVDYITKRLNVGNIYVNRNQIGAVVGSQPFGGEGLSGTGPKAGGPHYVSRFKRRHLLGHDPVWDAWAKLEDVQMALNNVKPKSNTPLQTVDMPGPTGESNRWSTYARGTILCLGPTMEDAEKQTKIANEIGCAAVAVAPGIRERLGVAGLLRRSALSVLMGFDAVALWSNTDDLRKARMALSERSGALVPLIASDQMKEFCVIERHICVDTTAAGGNASLLASQ